ncbi:NUDIX hydrolase, partial [Streptomyces sp. NPDC059506]|uniref:NUDIX hydrolase n=1 Tax=Streptomyces sp. NPDC059506 TaxID=3347751 RepID=UPI003687FB99
MATRYVWREGRTVPRELAVRQVYAWIVDPQGRVLLLDSGGRFNLPGGTPEPCDAGWEATLRREVWEEADVTVRDLVPLGHQEVHGDDGVAFAQMRVAARLERVYPSSPDPDGGQTHARCWVPLGQAAKLLGWGGAGAAPRAARRRRRRARRHRPTRPRPAAGSKK